MYLPPSVASVLKMQPMLELGVRNWTTTAAAGAANARARTATRTARTGAC
jgi:hypothetical protein